MQCVRVNTLDPLLRGRALIIMPRALIQMLVLQIKFHVKKIPTNYGVEYSYQFEMSDQMLFHFSTKVIGSIAQWIRGNNLGREGRQMKNSLETATRQTQTHNSEDVGFSLQ